MRSVCGFRRLVISAVLGFVLLAATPVGQPRLVFLEAEFDGDGGVAGLIGVSSVAMSPDGKHLYAVSWSDSAVVVFTRDATSGLLDFVQFHPDGFGGVDGIDSASSVAVSPDGKHVYIAGTGDDAVAVFSRNATTGGLSFVEAKFDGEGGVVNGLGGSISVTVSPDGKHVYAAGYDDDAIAVFERNVSTGALNFVEAKVNGGGISGLDGANSVTVSPDGKHVYAAGRLDSAVVVFQRSAVSGTLAFVHAQQDGVSGVDGLDEAMEVSVSPDGKHAYSVSSGDNAVAVFSRNVSTGELTFLEAEFDGEMGVEGLNWANSITVSPDGRSVYTAAVNSRSIAAFSRSRSTGLLEFCEVKTDGVAGVDGLAGADSVIVSPDGRHVYAAGNFDNAVAAFLVSYFDVFRADLSEANPTPMPILQAPRAEVGR